MKKNLFAILAILAMVAAVAPSCSNDDSNGDDQTPDATSIKGDVTSDAPMTLSAGTEWTISGPLRVKDGGVLTIEAGATISAAPSFYSYILVEKGGKIMAEGTYAKPITFKSTTDGAKWGGLILNGKAPVSGATYGTGSTTTEIDSDYYYGGNEPTDNSGTLTYIILKDTGANLNGDTEHNGLTLNGVGSGTTISDIFVDATSDDGVEFFGGTVNVTNLLVVNSDDDMFDFTEGYSGTLSNCYGIWEADYSSSEGDPSGVEADGNLDGNNASYVPQSNFTIEKMTIVNNASALDMYCAINVRRGATATISGIVKGSGNAKTLVCLAKSNGDATTATSIKVNNSMLFTTEFDYPTGNTAASYTAMDVADALAVGCDTSVFGWTGYSFE
ncbi:MAG: hypothetical protein SNH01_03990 [Rikenellaceae bacterium]